MSDKGRPPGQGDSGHHFPFHVWRSLLHAAHPETAERFQEVLLRARAEDDQKSFEAAKKRILDWVEDNDDKAARRLDTKDPK
jgi:hypothetical protein